LKRTTDFEYFCSNIKNKILENDNYPDVFLMRDLHFTPNVWKIWKSKLIEWFSQVNYTVIDSNNTERIIRIRYVKKNKSWTVEYIE